MSDTGKFRPESIEAAGELSPLMDELADRATARVMGCPNCARLEAALAQRDRALAWLAQAIVEHTGECPFSLEPADGDPDAQCAVVAAGEECRNVDDWWRCWYEAALAAAEEED